MSGPLHSLQPSFTAGELAPSLLGRVDFAKYASGLKTAKNGIVHPEGGFSNRPGFLFVAPAKFSDRKCRLISFEVSETQSYMIEFGHLYCRFYLNGGQISSVPFYDVSSVYAHNDKVQFEGIVYLWDGGPGHLSGNQNLTIPGNHDNSLPGFYTVGPLGFNYPEEIVTPYTEAELPYLKTVQSANTLYIAHKAHAPATLVRVSDTNWQLSNLAFENGPFDVLQSTSADLNVGAGTLTLGANFFQAGHVGALFKVVRSFPSVSTSKTTANGDGTDYVGPPYFWVYKSVNVVTSGTWAGTVSLYADLPGTGFTKITSFVSNNDANYNTFVDLSAYDYPLVVYLYAELGCTTVTMSLSGQAFTFSYIVKIASVIDTTHATVTVMNPPATILDDFTSTEWHQGSWSAVLGWPAVVAFFQDRLVLSSTDTDLATLWASQVGDYVDFGISDPLVDSDAISVNLNSRKLNAVQNMLSMIRLVPITRAGEFSIGPGATGIFAPTSIDQKVQGYRGSSYVNAVVIGNAAIYVEPMGTVIRGIGYQFYTDTFSGDNLSLLSNHLFRNFQIVDMAYQQEPDSLVWCVRDDGALLSMTYLPEQQVVGWTHHDTQGTFEAVATIPNSTLEINELWVVVNRTNGRFIERMAKRLPTFDVQDQVHLDCSVTYSGSPATVISGLDYLNGRSVIALADGSVQGPFTVSGGSITLDVEASIVHVGLSYTTDFETLPFNGNSQDGSSQGRRQRVAQCMFRFLNSVGGYVGSDFSHLHTIPQRTTQALGSPVPLLTYDFREPITSSWENQGRVVYRQTDPLPVTILMVAPITNLGDL